MITTPTRQRIRRGIRLITLAGLGVLALGACSVGTAASLGAAPPSPAAAATASTALSIATYQLHMDFFPTSRRRPP